MNTAAKGRKQENEVRKLLIAKGFEVERTYRKAIFIHGKVISLPNDFFGCMDLIAMSEEELKFIQVTTKPKALQEKITEALGHRWPAFVSVEIWLWYGGRQRKKRNNQEGDIKAQQYDIHRLYHDIHEFRYICSLDADGKLLSGA